MNICCVISSLTAGGAERVMAAVTNYWAGAGHEVTLVSVSDTSTDFYDLRPEIRRIGLDLRVESRSLRQGLANNWRRIHGLRAAIRQSGADVVISFLNRTNVLTVLAATGLRVPVIISERVDPNSHVVGGVWSLLRRLVYRRAQVLVVQSPKTKAWAERVVGRGRVEVIPNAIDARFLAPEENGGSDRRPVVIGMGRLDRQKGFDVLIRAFARIAQRYPEWSLHILGQGEQEAELKELAGSLLPPPAVEFHGNVADPERLLRQAGLFVLSSRYEGFPNALLEAMACGCPAISTDCPTGPADIIRPDVDGVLVPPDDVESLARQLDRLMGDETVRRRLGTQAVAVADRYSVEGVMREWDHLLGDLVANGSAR